MKEGSSTVTARIQDLRGPGSQHKSSRPVLQATMGSTRSCSHAIRYTALRNSGIRFQSLDDLDCEGRERCAVQAFIEGQEPVTPGFRVSPYEEVSEDASSA